MITNDILQHRSNGQRSSNLPETELHALKQLSENPKIIIKPADKGGAVVIMNTKDYINEGLRQLNDTKFYKPITKNPILKTTAEIQRFLNFLKERKLIPNDHITFLTPKNSRTPLFYMLPKIHKQNNPGRPIVSACDGPTENLSAYLDSFIKPLAQRVKSYVKDTNDFLLKLTDLGSIPPEAFLVTIDVTALYTNIPHRDAILAVKEELETRTNKNPLTWVLLRILHLILTKTAFRFYDYMYEQISGTTMGTICAPSMAIIFMGKIEEEFLATRTLLPLVWWRYIDDIFMVWPHSPTELYSFLSALNNVHETIKFTSNASQESVSFLDVMIHKDNKGQIETGLYTKPTDAHMYLHYNSYHPVHQKKSIPYSQAIRLRRICSTDIRLKEATDRLYKNLTKRGYPKKLVKQAIDRASRLDRKTLLNSEKQPETTENGPIPFIITHNPKNPPISKILTHNRRILASSGDTKYLLDRKFLLVNKRAKNLRQTLVRTDNRPPTIPNGSGPCQKPCTTCPFMKPSTTVICWTTKESIPIHGRFNCQSKNVIYIISCKLCGLQYVGQTGNTFNERFRGHLADIRYGNVIKPVSRHFTSNGHTVHDVFATILTQTTGNLNNRLRTEEAVIYKFNSRAPLGLNLRQ